MLWKDLTKKERKHLREMGINTLRQFKVNVELQAMRRRESPKSEPCWECRRITQKFGFPLVEAEEPEPVTKVIFRKWPKGSGENEIIALLPELCGDSKAYTCLSYSHVGQHGAADIGYVIQATKPAKPEEYKDLMTELQNQIGYKLQVIKRNRYEFTDMRRKALQR